jgi:hypothetical protein
MNLFGKKDKKEETPACACACNGNAEVKVDDAPVANTRLTSVKVLGSGCKSCKALLDNTNTALQNMKAGIDAEYVTDMAVVAGYGVMEDLQNFIVGNSRIETSGDMRSKIDILDLP